jgi:hypothetical protein
MATIAECLTTRSTASDLWTYEELQELDQEVQELLSEVTKAR